MLELNEIDHTEQREAVNKPHNQKKAKEVKGYTEEEIIDIMINGPTKKRNELMKLLNHR